MTSIKPTGQEPLRGPDTRLDKIRVNTDIPLEDLIDEPRQDIIQGSITTATPVEAQAASGKAIAEKLLQIDSLLRLQEDYLNYLFDRASRSEISPAEYLEAVSKAPENVRQAHTREVFRRTMEVLKTYLEIERDARQLASSGK